MKTLTILALIAVMAACDPASVNPNAASGSGGIAFPKVPVVSGGGATTQSGASVGLTDFCIPAQLPAPTAPMATGCVATPKVGYSNHLVIWCDISVATGGDITKVNPDITAMDNALTTYFHGMGWSDVSNTNNNPSEVAISGGTINDANNVWNGKTGLFIELYNVNLNFTGVCK